MTKIKPIEKFEGRKNSGRHKTLTEDQVDDARKLYAKGMSVAKLAEKFGKSRQTIYAALAGRGPYEDI